MKFFSLTCSRARPTISKKKKYFLFPDHQLAENLILVFRFYETTKKGKKVNLLRLFSYKNVSQTPCKILPSGLPNTLSVVNGEPVKGKSMTEVDKN